MIQDLKTLYRSARSPIVPHTEWLHFVKNHSDFKEKKKGRYLSMDSVPITKGMQMLTRILEIAGLQQLSRLGDNFYIYSTQLDNIVQEAQVAFNQQTQGKYYTSLFLQGVGTQEFVVTNLSNDNIKNLPLMSTSVMDWEIVKPLTLIYHDSDEQASDMVSSGRLKFYVDSPSVAYFVLDIEALIMKALVYSTMPGYTHQRFIHLEVLPSLIDDARDIWITRLHNFVISCILEGEDPVAETKHIKAWKRNQTQWSYIDPKFDKVIGTLATLYGHTQAGKLTPHNVLEMSLFTGNDRCMSLIDKVLLALDYQDVSDLTQFRALSLVRDMPYIDYLISVLRLNPVHPYSRNMFLELRTTLAKWRYSTPMNIIGSQKLRHVLNEKLARWESLSKYGA